VRFLLAVAKLLARVVPCSSMTGRFGQLPRVDGELGGESTSFLNHWRRWLEVLVPGGITVPNFGPDDGVRDDGPLRFRDAAVRPLRGEYGRYRSDAVGHRLGLRVQARQRDAFYLLVDDDGSVIGRFNVLDLRGHAPHLGYRVAERVAGRGVATAAVEEDVRHRQTWVRASDTSSGGRPFESRVPASADQGGIRRDR
jgi:hypothetical protein